MEPEIESGRKTGGLLDSCLADGAAGEGLEALIGRMKAALSQDDDTTLLTGLNGGAGSLLLAAWYDHDSPPGLIVTPAARWSAPRQDVPLEPPRPGTAAG